MSSCCPSSAAASSDISSGVKDYYGKVLKSSDDLQTTACQTPVTSSISKNIRLVMSQIHADVMSKYYGCGMCVPSCLTNMNVVDLGSGSGRDSYILSSLVGQQGNVIGVDMTDEQLAVANKYIDYHTTKFGYKQANVKFVKGIIEDLQKVGIDDNSTDIVISNCVVNLCEDKKKVLKEIYRILKFGGELYFSDVYCDRQLPQSVRKHQVLWRDVKFVSVVYRLFKVDKSKKTSEKKQVIYDGGVDGCEQNIKFDYKLEFSTETPMTIDDVTWNIINQSRLNDFFESKKASCCAKFVKTEIENPFEVVARDCEFTKPPTSSSCC